MLVVSSKQKEALLQSFTQFVRVDDIGLWGFMTQSPSGERYGIIVATGEYKNAHDAIQADHHIVGSGMESLCPLCGQQRLLQTEGRADDKMGILSPMEALRDALAEALFQSLKVSEVNNAKERI